MLELEKIKKLVIATKASMMEDVDGWPSDGYDFMDVDGMIVDNVDGLGRESITFSSSALANQNVSVFNSASMDQREITLSLILWKDSESIMSDINRAIPIGEKRRLFIETAETNNLWHKYWIEVYAGEAPREIGAGPETVEMVLIAPDPRFRGIDIRSFKASSSPIKPRQFYGDLPVSPHIEIITQNNDAGSITQNFDDGTADYTYESLETLISGFTLEWENYFNEDETSTGETGVFRVSHAVCTPIAIDTDIATRSISAVMPTDASTLLGSDSSVPFYYNLTFDSYTQTGTLSSLLLDALEFQGLYDYTDAPFVSYTIPSDWLIIPPTGTYSLVSVDIPSTMLVHVTFYEMFSGI